MKLDFARARGGGNFRSFDVRHGMRRSTVLAAKSWLESCIPFADLLGRIIDVGLLE
jgi:hypothetical protein